MWLRNEVKCQVNIWVYVSLSSFWTDCTEPVFYVSKHLHLSFWSFAFSPTFTPIWVVHWEENEFLRTLNLRSVMKLFHWWVKLGNTERWKYHKETRSLNTTPQWPHFICTLPVWRWWPCWLHPESGCQGSSRCPGSLEMNPGPSPALWCYRCRSALPVWCTSSSTKEKGW